MRFETNRNRPGAAPARHIGHWGRVLACLAAMASLGGAAQPGQQPLQRDPAWSTASQSANRMPDANDQRQMHDQQAMKQRYDAANAERKKQITTDSAKLLELATELKAEVEKTTQDTLSLNVIHKAGEIEKLARSVKEKMKLAAGPG